MTGREKSGTQSLRNRIFFFQSSRPVSIAFSFSLFFFILFSRFFLSSRGWKEKENGGKERGNKIEKKIGKESSL